MIDEKEERPWAQAWLRDETLEDLNKRIHGDDPADALYEGARFLHETAVKLWPSAAPKEGGRILDVGSGVGWPLQAAMDLFPGRHITGLDISEPMLTQAKTRLAELANAAEYEGRYDFKLYDGVEFPFPDDSFDFVYSYRVLWHIPEHALFPVLKEMGRVLRPGGAVILHFLPFYGMQLANMLKECENQRERRDDHYHYYYTYQKIHWWIGQILGYTDLDMREFAALLWVHFGKEGEVQMLDSEFLILLDQMYRQVLSRPGKESESDEGCGVSLRPAAALQSALDECEKELRAVYASTSWRITGPLRRAKIMSQALARMFSR